MIVVTGAAGFIASRLACRLVQEGYSDLLLVDHFPADVSSAKHSNLHGLENLKQMDRDIFPEWLTENAGEVSFVYHLGARTDTTEFDFRILDSLNLSYSKTLWEICINKQIPIIYASSAATYGTGEYGFDDEELMVSKLKPLNPYGLSKQLFDIHVLASPEKPPIWAGLKFFNVYGPHEQHKGRMASVVYHAYHQIRETGHLKLFQSHKPEYADGAQLRDFIYVEDVVDISMFFLTHMTKNGIYNVGTGQARSFNDLGKAVFAAMGLKESIEYIPIPMDIRDKYQYFTEAKMEKLIGAGYGERPFTSLYEGVSKYIAALQTLAKMAGG